MDVAHKKKGLSIKELIEILKTGGKDPNKKYSDLAKELGLAMSTLCTTIGQSEAITKNLRRFNVDVKQATEAQCVKPKSPWYDSKKSRQPMSKAAVSKKVDIAMETEINFVSRQI